MQAILAGRLLPLLKPGGGVRPLACGETLRRMAAKAATAAHKGAIAAAVGRRQFGVGRKNGIELMHRVVATALEKDPGAAVLSSQRVNGTKKWHRTQRNQNSTTEPKLNHGTILREIMPRNHFARNHAMEPFCAITYSGTVLREQLDMRML